LRRLPVALAEAVSAAAVARRSSGALEPALDIVRNRIVRIPARQVLRDRRFRSDRNWREESQELVVRQIDDRDVPRADLVPGNCAAQPTGTAAKSLNS